VFVKEPDPRIIQANIIDYIAFLRKSKSSASKMMYLSAIRKFYMLNDISLNWERIHSYEGEHEKVAEDRPYTHSEVQQMISHTTIRNKARRNSNLWYPISYKKIKKIINVHTYVHTYTIIFFGNFLTYGIP
jgi:hypothetical protein